MIKFAEDDKITIKNGVYEKLNVWSTLSNTKLSKLNRLHKRAKNVIVNAKYQDG